MPHEASIIAYPGGISVLTSSRALSLISTETPCAASRDCEAESMVEHWSGCFSSWASYQGHSPATHCWKVRQLHGFQVEHAVPGRLTGAFRLVGWGASAGWDGVEPQMCAMRSCATSAVQSTLPQDVADSVLRRAQTIKQASKQANKPKKPNQTNQANQTNQTDQTNQTNQANQTNQTNQTNRQATKQTHAHTHTHTSLDACCQSATPLYSPGIIFCMAMSWRTAKMSGSLEWTSRLHGDWTPMTLNHPFSSNVFVCVCVCAWWNMSSSMSFGGGGWSSGKKPRWIVRWGAQCHAACWLWSDLLSTCFASDVGAGWPMGLLHAAGALVSDPENCTRRQGMVPSLTPTQRCLSSAVCKYHSPLQRNCNSGWNTCRYGRGLFESRSFHFALWWVTQGRDPGRGPPEPPGAPRTCVAVLLCLSWGLRPVPGQGCCKALFLFGKWPLRMDGMKSRWTSTLWLQWLQWEFRHVRFRPDDFRAFIQELSGL